MTKIVLHDGRAHQDEFLAACVLIYKLGVPAYRRSHTEEDLKDPDTWVLDQGRDFNVELHNFDHHQLEEPICSFTMVLDYFFSEDYRDHMPQLRYVEIFDSYGPNRAAAFAGATVESLETSVSPAYIYLMKAFSKIQGEINDSFYNVMKEIGKEICESIDENEKFLRILEESSIFFEYRKIKILDTTSCVLPEGLKHDKLPTKTYAKLKKIQPDVVLTVDTRQEGYRMISINSDVLKFRFNDKCHFVHNSGFLVGFKNYDDYEYILKNHTELHDSKRQ
jgi:hypothetical protein